MGERKSVFLLVILLASFVFISSSLAISPEEVLQWFFGKMTGYEAALPPATGSGGGGAILLASANNVDAAHYLCGNVYLDSTSDVTINAVFTKINDYYARYFMVSLDCSGVTNTWTYLTSGCSNDKCGSTATYNTTGTATASNPVTFQGYQIFSDLGGSNWTRIVIKDMNGATIDTFTANEGGAVNLFTINLIIHIISVSALEDGTIVGTLLTASSSQIEMPVGAEYCNMGVGAGNQKFSYTFRDVPTGSHKICIWPTTPDYYDEVDRMWMVELYRIIPSPYNDTTCTHKNPGILIYPSSQSAPAGTNLRYKISVSNYDDSSCGPSTFMLWTPYPPSGWPITISPGTMNLSPGTSADATLLITSPINSTAGSYNIKVKVDSNGMSNEVIAIYNVAQQTTCIDSDNGKNYYVKGCMNNGVCDQCGLRQTDGTMISKDYCKDESNCVLFEVECTSSNQFGGYNGGDYRCPNGCRNGACILSSNLSNVDGYNHYCFQLNDIKAGTKINFNYKSVDDPYPRVFMISKDCTDIQGKRIYTWEGCSSANCSSGEYCKIGVGGSSTYTYTFTSDMLGNHIICTWPSSDHEPGQTYIYKWMVTPVITPPVNITPNVTNSCPYQCCENELNYLNKPCPQLTIMCLNPPCPTYACRNHQCVLANQTLPECPYECCKDDPKYKDKQCMRPPCAPCPANVVCPSCPTYTCKDYRCVSESTESEYNLRFYEGWNLFSIPVDKFIDVDELLSGCELATKVWYYSDGNYQAVNNVGPGLGYWVKVKSNCVVTISGEDAKIDDFEELKKGWNMIGALGENINFFKVIGDCDLVNGPWRYNTNVGKFEKSQVLMPGYGYFVKLGSSCKLGTEIPPMPPEEWGIAARAIPA